MNKKEFLDLVWKLEEIMMHRDYLRRQIGECGEGCDDGDEGLCPECSQLFELVITEDERLAKNKELNEVQRKLKQACEEDKTGEYQRILNQSRDSKLVH